MGSETDTDWKAVYTDTDWKAVYYYADGTVGYKHIDWWEASTVFPLTDRNAAGPVNGPIVRAHLIAPDWYPAHGPVSGNAFALTENEQTDYRKRIATPWNRRALEPKRSLWYPALEMESPDPGF